MKVPKYWKYVSCSTYTPIHSIYDEDEKAEIKVMDKVQSDEIPNVEFPPDDDKSTMLNGNHAPDIFDLEFFIGIAFPPIINDPDFVKALEHFIKGDNAPSRSFIEECSWMYYLFYDPVGTTEHTVTLQVILIRLVSMAILLDKAAKVKYLTRPGRNRGICIKVFLLSNEGAHAYNGNGAFFGRPRRQEYIPLMEHDETEPASGFEVNRIVVFKPTYIYCNTHPEVTTKFVDACTQYDIKEPSGNPNLSVDTLQRSPSDKDIGTIALNIGPEWHSLGLQLGLSEVELYQIREDNRENCVQRNSAMLFRWRRNKENCATFEELCNACIRINANPDNILKNIEEA
ncbi:uncharacterized protein LOC123551957 isoform X2 [Mercenaria mercenaria]|uniref:uncharacterized protein LOC123551957 isoform X2 n=1 Tax=Mercenaria mercenaria TaxID=6596 RepID=UPI00234E53BB|nr:uncharacterized protein LOC123551957 isoform X2 [Mercenaria mercenaria]